MNEIFNTEITYNGKICNIHKYLILNDFLIKGTYTNAIYYVKNNITILGSYFPGIIIEGKFKDKYEYVISYNLSKENISTVAFYDILSKLDLGKNNE